METLEGKGRASRAAVEGKARRKQGLGDDRLAEEGRMGRRLQGGEDFHLSISRYQVCHHHIAQRDF